MLTFSKHATKLLNNYYLTEYDKNYKDAFKELLMVTILELTFLNAFTTMRLMVGLCFLVPFYPMAECLDRKKQDSLLAVS